LEFALDALVEDEGAFFVGFDGGDRALDESGDLGVGAGGVERLHEFFGHDGAFVGGEGRLGVVGGHGAPACHAHFAGEAEDVAEGFQVAGIGLDGGGGEPGGDGFFAALEEAVLKCGDGGEKVAACGHEAGPGVLEGLDCGAVGGDGLRVALVVGARFA